MLVGVLAKMGWKTQPMRKRTVTDTKMKTTKICVVVWNQIETSKTTNNVADIKEERRLYLTRRKKTTESCGQLRRERSLWHQSLEEKDYDQDKKKTRVHSQRTGDLGKKA